MCHNQLTTILPLLLFNQVTLVMPQWMWLYCQFKVEVVREFAICIKPQIVPPLSFIYGQLAWVASPLALLWEVGQVYLYWHSVTMSFSKLLNQVTDFIDKVTTEVSKLRNKMWTEPWVTSVSGFVTVFKDLWQWLAGSWNEPLDTGQRKISSVFSKPFLRDVFQNVLRNTQLEADRRWVESGPPYFPGNGCIGLWLVSKWAGYGEKVVGGGKKQLSLLIG